LFCASLTTGSSFAQTSAKSSGYASKDEWNSQSEAWQSQIYAIFKFSDGRLASVEFITDVRAPAIGAGMISGGSVLAQS
jgi:hypothetical protein